MPFSWKATNRLMGRALLWLTLALPFVPALVLSWPGRWFVFDVIAQISNVFIWFGLFWTLVILFLRRWRFAMIAGAGTFLSLAAYATVVKPVRVPPVDPAPQSQRLRIVSFNAYVPFVSDHSLFLKWALAHDPDVIAIVEGPLVPESCNQILYERGYHPQVIPQRVYGPLWSKWPTRVFREYWDGAPMTPGGVNPFLIEMPNGQPLAISSVHLSSPRRPSSWRWDLDMVQLHYPLLRQVHGRYHLPLVLMGDFNTARSGRVYRELYEQSGLTDAESSFFPSSTWPSNLPGFLGVGIDHCWVSPGVAVTKYEVGPKVASDHRPLFVELHIPPAENPKASHARWHFLPKPPDTRPTTLPAAP